MHTAMHATTHVPVPACLNKRTVRSNHGEPTKQFAGLPTVFGSHALPLSGALGRRVRRPIHVARTSMRRRGCQPATICTVAAQGLIFVTSPSLPPARILHHYWIEPEHLIRLPAPISSQSTTHKLRLIWAHGCHTEILKHRHTQPVLGRIHETNIQVQKRTCSIRDSYELSLSS
jgi:hypothetical protein